MTQHRFKVIPNSRPRGDDLWDWSMWIEPVAEATLENVRWVTYSLHPCFPNPNRVIRNPDHGFRLEMSSATGPDATWGRFVVRVTIVLADGSREFHDPELDLRRIDGTAAPPLMPLPPDADYAQCERYYRRLVQKSAFGYAREVLAHAEKVLPASATAGQRLWLAQQKALCTYKNPSLPNDTRLQEALAMLQAAPCLLDPATTTDPETLGLGGAVYKRMWEIDRVRKNLELSLACYRRSYERALERKTIPDILADGSYDAGAFGGANVIYLCSLLACEVPAEIDASYHADRQAEAGRVRRQLAADLPALQALRPADWWIAATLLDAYLGLSYADPQWEEAALKQARAVAKLAPSAWEKQSTGSQLLSAARLEKQLRPEQAARIDKLSKRIVAEAFRGGVDYRGAEFDGKLGLALSGGGFRASFFHIGVLARLAELDLLRHVEVISCVSGGSIVGAHYYLLLRRLLQTTPDGRIEHGHYLKIVEDLLDQFLAGVQKNIRMRVAASWLANLRMILQPNTYSRSQRLGYLYEKYLYAQVVDGEEKHKRWLNDAFIVPRRDDETWDDSFSPKLENWLRAAKVPVLALNATALNTGRNWQFTASWMGEPLSYGSGVDSTERLEPVYYSEAQELRQFRFGDAVAASSCVPALFAPIVVAGLYEERIVRLVDGGVHDNQGTRALLDQDCDAVVVSDASGQMSSEKNPPHGALGVLLRTNSVLQARVRVAQHQELQVRERTNLVRKCAFLHLRKSVESLPVAAIGAHVASEADSAAAARLPEITDYGVNRQVQIALASLRTDLDSFTDREALALMYSGYAMADKYLGEFASGAGVTRHNWRFLALHAPMQGKPAPGLDHEKFVGHLKVGSRLAFKVWFLHPALKALGIVLIVAAAVAIAWALVDLMHAQVRIPLDVSGMARKALYFLAGALVVAAIPAALRFKKPIDQAMHPATVVRKLLIGVAMAIAGWLVCRIHLWIFDRLFLALGRVKEARPAASVRGGTSP